MGRVQEPALSVVLVTPTALAQLRRTLTSLAAQTIAERIEMVIVAPDHEAMQGADPLLSRFHSHRVVAAGPIANVDHAAARGLVEAAAPIVASIEDHAFPEPEWAERLLEAWDADCVAVGSAIMNANPRNGLSWSNQLIAYGRWSEAAPEGETDWVALHNGSYRRAALAPFGDELPRLFNRESEVLRRMQAAGGRFAFAPRARIRHINPSALGATARLRVDAGRLYAANRARDEGWGLGKRAAYALLGPLIPLVRYAKMRKELFGGGGTVRETRHGPYLMVGLIFDALGQMVGYLGGPGRARDRLATFEMDRMQHLDARDRAVFAG
jgi:Glycosyl transferase family 2